MKKLINAYIVCTIIFYVGLAFLYFTQGKHEGYMRQIQQPKYELDIMIDSLKIKLKNGNK